MQSKGSSFPINFEHSNAAGAAHSGETEEAINRAHADDRARIEALISGSASPLAKDAGVSEYKPQSSVNRYPKASAVATALAMSPSSTGHPKSTTQTLPPESEAFFADLEAGRESAPELVRELAFRIMNKDDRQIYEALTKDFKKHYEAQAREQKKETSSEPCIEKFKTLAQTYGLLALKFGVPFLSGIVVAYNYAIQAGAASLEEYNEGKATYAWMLAQQIASSLINGAINVTNTKAVQDRLLGVFEKHGISWGIAWPALKGLTLIATTFPAGLAMGQTFSFDITETNNTAANLISLPDGMVAGTYFFNMASRILLVSNASLTLIDALIPETNFVKEYFGNTRASLYNRVLHQRGIAYQYLDTLLEEARFNPNPMMRNAAASKLFYIAGVLNSLSLGSVKNPYELVCQLMNLMIKEHDDSRTGEAKALTTTERLVKPAKDFLEWGKTHKARAISFVLLCLTSIVLSVVYDIPQYSQTRKAFSSISIEDGLLAQIWSIMTCAFLLLYYDFFLTRGVLACSTRFIDACAKMQMGAIGEGVIDLSRVAIDAVAIAVAAGPAAENARQHGYSDAVLIANEAAGAPMNYIGVDALVGVAYSKMKPVARDEAIKALHSGIKGALGAVIAEGSEYPAVLAGMAKDLRVFKESPSKVSNSKAMTKDEEYADIHEGMSPSNDFCSVTHNLLKGLKSKMLAVGQNYKIWTSISESTSAATQESFRVDTASEALISDNIRKAALGASKAHGSKESKLTGCMKRPASAASHASIRQDDLKVRLLSESDAESAEAQPEHESKAFAETKGVAIVASSTEQQQDLAMKVVITVPTRTTPDRNNSLLTPGAAGNNNVALMLSPGGVSRSTLPTEEGRSSRDPLSDLYRASPG